MRGEGWRLAKKGVLSGGDLGLNTLCRGCSSHTTLVGLLYPRGDKSEERFLAKKGVLFGGDLGCKYNNNMPKNHFPRNSQLNPKKRASATPQSK